MTPGMPPLPPGGGMAYSPVGDMFGKPGPALGGQGEGPKGFASDQRSMPPPTMPQGAPGTAPTPGMPPLPPGGGISQAMSNLPNYVANGNRMGPPMTGQGLGPKGFADDIKHQHDPMEAVRAIQEEIPIHEQAKVEPPGHTGSGISSPSMDSLMSLPERNPAGQAKPGLPEFNASGRGALGGANQVLGRNIQDTGMFSPPPLPGAGPVNPATGMSGPTNAAKHNVPGMPPPPGITPASRLGRQVNSGIASAAQAAGPNQSNGLIYKNQNATRKYDLKPELAAAATNLNAHGYEFHVTSGGQDKPFRYKNKKGQWKWTSHRHTKGGAGDGNIYYKGRKLDYANKADRPLIENWIAGMSAQGYMGVGMGGSYMGSDTVHVGGTNVRGGGGAYPRGSTPQTWHSYPGVAAANQRGAKLWNAGGDYNNIFAAP